MAKNDWLDRLDPDNHRAERMVIVGQLDIDRDEANEWLLRVKVDHQRNLAPAVVERYRTDMDEDEWVEGSQIIAFDGKANLINGQHVLSAFARSTMKKLPVIWEINRHPNAYMAFDHNRKRTARDTLKWHGVERPGEIQAAATVLWCYEKGCYTTNQAARNKYPTDPQIQQTVKMHPGLDQHLWKSPLKGKEFSIGALNACSYILHNIDAKVAADFYDRFINGTNLPSRQYPINVLRRYFMDLEKGQRLRAGETMAAVFKAWNAFVRAEDIAGRLMRRDEVFPDPISPHDLAPLAPKTKAKAARVN